MHRIFSKLLTFSILILPFIIWQGSFEGPKVFLFLTTGFGLTSFWIYRIVFKKKNIYLGKADFFFIAWLTILVVASIFGAHPLESILGGSYRHQGVLFFFTLWLVYKTVQLFNPQEKHLLGQGLAVTVLVESLILFGQFIFGRVYFGKPLGTLGEANAVAGFIGIGSYFVIQYLPKVYLVIPVIAILITASRSGILSLLPNFILRTRKIVVFLALIAAVLIIGIISQRHINSLFENRPLIWKLGVEAISKRPIFGFGAESGEVVYNFAFANINLPLNSLIIDRAHNLFLDVGMWSGGMGLIFFIGFLTTYFRTLENKYQKLGFVSFLIYSMFQPLSVIHWLLFVLL